MVDFHKLLLRGRAQRHAEQGWDGWQDAVATDDDRTYKLIEEGWVI